MSLLPELIVLVRSYLKPYENAVIDNSTGYIVECAANGWIGGFAVQGYRDADKAMEVAIQFGHIELVKHMLDTDFIGDSIADCVATAAQYGQLTIIDLLIPYMFHSPLELAVRNGHYDMVVKLMRLTRPTNRMLLSAAGTGREDIFDLLLPFTTPSVMALQLVHSVYYGGSLTLIRKYGSGCKNIYVWNMVDKPSVINYVLQKGWDASLILANIKMQPVCNLKSLAITLAFKPIDPGLAKDPIAQRILSF